MAWYKRRRQRRRSRGGEAQRPGGGVHQVPGLPGRAAHGRPRQERRRLPAVRAPLPDPAARRLELILDPGTFEEADASIESVDPLGLPDSKRYGDRLRAARRNAGGADAVLVGAGRIEGQPVEVGVFVFEFMGGSMGSVVGEKVTRVFERALERQVPAIVFSASGGARMQEGVLSLMQMAKTSAALGRLREAGLPYISVLLHPTTGGVAASFAMLGDVILAEPKALIGFAGRARHPEHDPPAAAAGLPARRVPARARLPGQDRPPQASCGRRWRSCCACSAHEPDGLTMAATPSCSRGSTACATLGVELGLERVRLALARLGDPQRRFAAVQIAGTNGKGSTAAMTEAVLRGRRPAHRAATRRRTSARFTERIRIAGREADGDRLAALDRPRRRDRGAADLLRGRDRARVPGRWPRTGVDVAVLETGLGGRLDAVTTCEPLRHGDHVDRDRSHRLPRRHAAGDRAREGRHPQAGGAVLRRPAAAPRPTRVIARRAAAAGAPLRRLGRDFAVPPLAGRAGRRAPARQRRDRGRAGARGGRAAGQADRRRTRWRAALAGVRWPGRLRAGRRRPAVRLRAQRRRRRARWRRRCAALAPGRRVVLLMSIVDDKDPAGDPGGAGAGRRRRSSRPVRRTRARCPPATLAATAARLFPTSTRRATTPIAALAEARGARGRGGPGRRRAARCSWSASCAPTCCGEPVDPVPTSDPLGAPGT